MENRILKKRLAGCMLVMMLLMSVPAYAGAPMSAVESTVNRVLDVLRDPKMKGPAAKSLKTEKLRVIYKDMFDEMEFSRRTLTRNWNKFTPEQRRSLLIFLNRCWKRPTWTEFSNIPTRKLFFTRNR